MSSTRGTKRRAVSVDDASDYDEPAADVPKRSKGSAKSSAAGPVVKKQQRMERNRQAAQASRDRRKAYTEELERKIQDLEDRIVACSSVVRSASPAPSMPAAGADRIAQLEAENAALHQQLAASQSENIQVQSRMDGLESKLEWLTQAMGHQQAASAQAASSSRVYASPSSSVLSPSISPRDLQQAMPSPATSSASLDPQTLLALLSPSQTSVSNTAIPPLSSSVAASFGQIESLVARERFLPRTQSNQKPCSITADNRKTAPLRVAQMPLQPIHFLHQPQQKNSLRSLKNSLSLQHQTAPCPSIFRSTDRTPTSFRLRRRYFQQRQTLPSTTASLTRTSLLEALKRNKSMALRLVSEWQ